MDYTKLQASAGKAIKKFGQTVTFFRDGIKLGTTEAVVSELAREDDSASLQAQTGLTKQRLMVRPLKQSVQTGDTLTVSKATYTVTRVTEVKPAAVVLYVIVEVV